MANTEMLVIRGAMGRDIAAFSYFADALQWALAHPYAGHLSFVADNGKTTPVTDFTEAGAIAHWLAEQE